MQLRFHYNDGGRKLAGFKKTNVGDCACRSIAIVTRLPYKTIYNKLNKLGKLESTKTTTYKTYGQSHAGKGVLKTTIGLLMAELGWTWVPCKYVGKTGAVHMIADELPYGRLLISMRYHVTAVLYHTEHSTYNSSREGKSCVYGYWIKKNV